MTRIRLIMLSFFAVLALSAVASASASAEACDLHTTGEEWEVCAKTAAGVELEWGSPGPGKMTQDNTAVNSTLKGEVGGFEAKLKGTFNKLNLTIEDSNKSKGTIEFKNITVESPKKCIVAEPIIAEFTDTIVGATPVELVTGSKPGETFAEIEFKDKGTEVCPVKNTTFKVTGKQECSFDANILTYLEHHEVKCLFAGSKLVLGGKPAKFEEIFTEVEPESEEVEAWKLFQS